MTTSMRRRGRRRLLWYIATGVILASVAVAAVVLTGAARRADDRAAYLDYERAVLPPIKEGGRIVQQEMKPSLREISDGDITGGQLVDRAAAWRRAFTMVREQILAAAPPAFLGDIETRWGVAMEAYLSAVIAFEAIARGQAADRSALVDQAATAGERADKLFDRGAEVMQLHRRRLGLGASADFPDPSAS